MIETPLQTSRRNGFLFGYIGRVLEDSVDLVRDPTMSRVLIVANAHCIGKHVSNVILLLNALKEMRKGARGKDGHISAIMKGLVLMYGRVLDVKGRIG